MKRARTRLRLFWVASVFSVAVFTPAQAKPASARTTIVSVPFVGCASDGQLGPLAAPKGKTQPAAISVEAAKHLAYYKAEYTFGVLAPRGWHCFSTYGSSGSSLYVSPDLISSQNLLSSTWKGFTGPAIQLSISNGGTSGRFAVARAIARYFPSQKAFLGSVLAEGIEPAGHFPSGRYTTDKLEFLTPDMVEFETPAYSKGQGTDSWLLPNAGAIHGVVLLLDSDEEPNLVQLTIRLPKADGDLLTPILNDSERDSSHR